MKDLTYIEEYIKSRKNNISDFSTRYYVKPDGKTEYWARFYMKGTESIEFIVKCSSFEEVTHKIAEYLKSGNHYSYGRAL